MNTAQVVGILERIAQLLEVSGENPFKVRAYRNAARAIEAESDDVAALVEQGRLQDLKGIGKAIAEKITTLVETGSLPYLDELQRSVPAGLAEMLRIPGLGPKKAKAVHEKLGVEDLDGLEAAARDGSLAKLSGFGKKTAQAILEGIAFVRTSSGQHLYGEALAIGRAVLDAVRAHPSVARAEIAGSLRRRREVVKDIDIIASTDDPAAVMDLFVGLPLVERVTGRGSAKSSALLAAARGQIACDVRVCDGTVFPFLLHHFSGSKDHNVALRRRAIKRGLRMSEWGLFEGDAETSLACADEAELFGRLGLAFIPPELREDRGEIDAAGADALPKPIETGDIRADLHMHSTWSDGKASIAQMAAACRAIGYRYIGIADHSQAASYAGGLGPKALQKQAREIDNLNDELGDKLTVLKSSEVDILADGALDFDDKTLDTLDYVVASVHSRFAMPIAEMTGRIIRAVEHPATTVIGHLTGRLLLAREGYGVAVDEVLSAAAEHGTAIEINANPHRLDLDWRHVRAAKEKGVKLSINTDAHAPDQLGFMDIGIGIARKGWLEKGDVINTFTLAQFRKFARGRA